MNQPLAGLLLLALLSALNSAAIAQEGPQRQLYYEAAYVRETADRAWTVKLGAGVMSRPGCYIIIHDVAGKLIAKHHVPYAQRTDAAPVALKIPADGITGDYRIVFIGFQNDVMGINLPMTDLPFEVYGRRNFAANRNGKIFFKTAPDTGDLTFNSHSGGLRVLLDGKPVADTSAGTPQAPAGKPATFTPQPDAAYQIEPITTFYFTCDKNIYLTYDIARWFTPDPKLEDVKWWQLTKP